MFVVRPPRTSKPTKRYAKFYSSFLDIRNLGDIQNWDTSRTALADPPVVVAGLQIPRFDRGRSGQRGSDDRVGIALIQSLSALQTGDESSED